MAPSPEYHWANFKEFCILETELKGPDPQLETLAVMCRNNPTDLMDTVWRAGLVMGVWNVPTAEVIWRHFSWERAALHPEQITPWLTEHWRGIFRRRERRCVNTIPKMAIYMEQLARWVPKIHELPADYESWWNSVQEVKFMGRYVALKYLEFLHRYVQLGSPCPDIRADGGWSPVRSMGLMYATMNEQIEAAPTNQEKILIAERFAEMTLKRLQMAGININYFQLQVMLCEYRTCYEHRHQYPGRSLDEELEFVTKLNTYWSNFDETTGLYQARAETFANVALGELNGWNAIRKELGAAFRDHGYHWSDLRYDYPATTDISQPARRS